MTVPYLLVEQKEIVMTTQRAEAVYGTVIGYGAVVSPGMPDERRVHFTTVEEWEKLIRECEAEDRGMEFFTRIQGPNGIEESEGANPKQVPVGSVLRKLTCTCGTAAWFTRTHATRFRCEACASRAAYWAEQQALIDGD